ncbi:hypothetical protein NE584_00710 [Clostridium sp. DFI.5.61]|uniref:phage baseplate protein n=1 Tax=Clostridium sp. DFI.5.61 TaxID=2965279 RepID=UPI00210C5FFE|nr:hypothetical protein [Clostridium sp. DFI.5.61]MCB5924235.1 hypothetical protein [bacterium 210820-DFI.5.26]MCQ5157561.1 hypothetical protein [Clostridium sp. DFI.5.61]
MGKATQPVSINGLEFDALIDESRTLEATVPEYSVESGFSVSDSIILSPEQLSMTLFVTNTPVTWYRRHGASPTRVESVVKQLEELYFAKEPVTIVTSDATYTSMAIESLTISKSLETGYARQIPISFKKIRVTTAKTTTIPDSYGKSGKTAASAGTASTSTGSSGGGSGSGSGSSGGSSGAGGSSSSNGNSNSSILYNAASSIGLI